jgi:hypothetical protein
MEIKVMKSDSKLETHTLSICKINLTQTLGFFLVLNESTLLVEVICLGSQDDLPKPTDR